VVSECSDVNWFDFLDMNTYNIDMKSRVGERGQITIPKAMRTRLGISPGTEVEFEELEDGLMVRKRAASDPLEALRGLISEPVDVDAYLAETRGPAWKPSLDGKE
jgi:AbrB family looped-hinge helix DNA binding protein